MREVWECMRTITGHGRRTDQVMEGDLNETNDLNLFFTGLIMWLLTNHSPAPPVTPSTTTPLFLHAILPLSPHHYTTIYFKTIPQPSLPQYIISSQRLLFFHSRPLPCLLHQCHLLSNQSTLPEVRRSTGVWWTALWSGAE